MTVAQLDALLQMCKEMEVALILMLVSQTVFFCSVGGFVWWSYKKYNKE